MLQIVGRVAAVLIGAALALGAGSSLLRANAAVRPVWTGAQALAIARGDLQKAQAAEATAQQDVASLQQQAQDLAQQADGLSQFIQAAQDAAFGGGFAQPSRRRGFRDDGFGGE
jgi:uncharacterized membrane protein YccC